MRRPGTKGRRPPECKGTGDHVHQQRSPGRTARGAGCGNHRRGLPATARSRRSTGTPRCGHKPGMAGDTRQTPPGPPRRSTSWRPSSTPPHQRRARDRKWTSTPTTISPSPPSWCPAVTGAPNTEPTTTPALRRVLQDEEPTSPARDPSSVSHQAHLRRNYASLGSSAETPAPTGADGHAGGQPDTEAFKAVFVSQNGPQKPKGASIGLIHLDAVGMVQPWDVPTMTYVYTVLSACLTSGFQKKPHDTLCDTQNALHKVCHTYS